MIKDINYDNLPQVIQKLQNILKLLQNNKLLQLTVIKEDECSVKLEEDPKYARSRSSCDRNRSIGEYNQILQKNKASKFILDLDPDECKQEDKKVEIDQKEVEKAEQTTQVNCIQPIKNVVKAQKLILNPAISRVIESRAAKEDIGTGSASIEDSFAMDFES